MKTIPILTSILLCGSPLLPGALLYDFGAGGTVSPTGSIPGISAGTVTSSNFVSTALQNNVVSAGYPDASGAYNLNGRIVGTSGLDLATSSFHSFTLTPTSGNFLRVSDLSFGYRLLIGSIVPEAFAVYYQTGGGSPTQLAPAQDAIQDSLWYLTTFTPIAPVTTATDESITFYIYGYRSGSGDAANNSWRIDDIAVGATAIPEPTALFLSVPAALLLLGRGRKRRPTSQPANP